MTEVKPTPKQLMALVGNPDVYAVQKDDGTYLPVRDTLTMAVMRKHVAGDITVGTYIVKPPDTARTLVFDIDAGNDEEQQRMLSAVLDVLTSLGLPNAVEFSGNKGYHVWVVCEDYMPAETLYRLGRGVREEAGLPKLEVFPKQTTVRDLGNLVKLPGGVHRVTGKANNFITVGHGRMELVGAGQLQACADKYPEVRVARGSDGVVTQPCVHNIQGGVTEGGRNNHLFHLAVMLRRASLTEENIAYVVGTANERSEPPLEQTELETLLESSKSSGPICRQLDEDVQCGEECITRRHYGLYTRPGNLRFGAKGELAVVEIAKRTVGGTTVELAHPDITQARAVLSEPALEGRKKRDGKSR